MLHSPKYSFRHPRFIYFLLLLFTAVIILLSWDIESSQHKPSDTAVSYTPSNQKNENQIFIELTHKLFLSEISSNAITLNAMLVNPEAYNINSAPASPGHYSSAILQNISERSKNLVSELSSIACEKLSENNRMLYEQLLIQSELRSKLYSDILFFEPLSPAKGTHTYLPIILAEYNINSINDAEQYLRILSGIPELFNEILEFEAEKLEKGFFMTPKTASQVSAQCLRLNESALLDILLSHYIETLDKLQLDKPEKEGYIRCCSDIILTQVAPAYKQLAADIKQLSAAAVMRSCVCYQNPDSYSLSVQLSTGSSMSIEEMRSSVEKLLAESLIHIYSTDIKTLSEPKKDIVSASAKEMLDILSSSITDLFPVSSNLNYSVNSLPSALSSQLGSAMYLIPPFDDYKNNVIYINSSFPSDAALFTTLAHEGFPGHMYMTVGNMERSLNPYSILASPIGYEEGWAVYGEVSAYKYIYPDNPTADFYACNMLAVLCLHSLADIGVNYSKWTKDECVSFFKQYSLDEMYAEEIYYTVLGDPGLFLPYSIGYIEWCSLRDHAHSLWGDSFDLLTFHSFVLQPGPSLFCLIENYISSVKIKVVNIK